MVNDEWSGGQALENAFRVADEELRKVERERDAAVARADQLRDERDGAVQSCITVGRARDEWRARAEAAEARTTPAVTRQLVYDAVGAVYDVPWPGVEPITDAVCHLFRIETAPDPVETLAVQIEDATRRAVRQACETLAPVAAGLNPEVIEEMMDITEASRRLARHVLGQEADE